MIKVIARRLLGALPNLAGVIVVTFLLTRALPGDPAAYFAGGAATQEAVAQVRAQLGLDKPLVEQFFRYVADLAHGELGTSLTTGQPVLQELLSRLPASIEMVLLALTLACAIALPLGVLAATRPGSWIDQLCRLVTTAGVSLPTFFTGLLLAYVFYFLLGWAPSPLGRLDPMFSPPPQISGFYLIDAALAGDASLWWASFKQLILPTLTMAIFVLAPIARMTRASMLSVLGSDFIRTARASGLTSSTVLVTYALRNALLPVVTLAGVQIGHILGGSILVETVFNWPGSGQLMNLAIFRRDIPVLQATVVVLSFFFVLINLSVDVLQAAIDPRIRR